MENVLIVSTFTFSQLYHGRYAQRPSYIVFHIPYHCNYDYSLRDVLMLHKLFDLINPPAWWATFTFTYCILFFAEKERGFFYSLAHMYLSKISFLHCYIYDTLQ